jgi:hypothetical protein
MASQKRYSIPVKKRTTLGFVLLTLASLSLPIAVNATCADRKVYFCVPVIFQKADPSLKKKDAFAGHCAGMMDIKGKSTAVVFQDKGECPNYGSMAGHLISICQDTGHWTEATYWFANRPEFCGMTYKERRKEARKLADSIVQGMTRAKVRELLSKYEFIGGGFGASFTEQYYGHPNVVIEVPFEQPGGNYSSTNQVNGPVTVAEMLLPQP